MHERLETRTFLLFLILVSCSFLWILKPFFSAVFWAVAIAIIFFPIQQRLLKRWPNRPNFAALMTLLLCIVVVILPVIFVIGSVIEEAVLVYESIQSGKINPTQYIESIGKGFPLLNSLLERVGLDLDRIKTDAINALTTSGKFLAMHTLAIGQNAFSFLVSLAIMLYITFFLLRDGKKLTDLLVLAMPLGDSRERTLITVFAEVIRATIKGNIVIALLQGTIGGVTLWALDIHAAMLFGALMAMFSLIPAVGSALVWAPIALYLAATGDTTSALILTGVGAGVIGMLDNVLRPILVGRDTQLPDYVVLLSTLGGISLFGVNGFVIGPVVAAMFIAFWGIFIREVDVLAADGNPKRERTRI
ncbi:MAG: AI-2E family transporter [Pseudomonadota bacterium]